MKKFFALCGIVATLFAACEPVENGNDATPTFEIKSKTEISVGAGSTMGIIKGEKSKNRNPEASKETLQLQEQLIELGQNFINELKKYLLELKQYK